MAEFISFSSGRDKKVAAMTAAYVGMTRAKVSKPVGGYVDFRTIVRIFGRDLREAARGDAGVYRASPLILACPDVACGDVAAADKITS